MTRLFVILYRELSARPLLAFVIATGVASFLTAYADERKRLVKLIDETSDFLNANAERVEARAARARVEELHASSEFSDADWEALYRTMVHP